MLRANEITLHYILFRADGKAQYLALQPASPCAYLYSLSECEQILFHASTDGQVKRGANFHFDCKVMLECHHVVAILSQVRRQ